MQPRQRPHRRQFAAARAAAVARRLALAWFVGAAGIGMAGCAAPTTGSVSDSQSSFERTFDVALAAMAEQRMIFSAQDRRQGRIVGTVDGLTLVATLDPIVDGTTRVSFQPQGDSPGDAALLKRVSDSYKARMSKLGLLGGFKDSSDANQRGPVPCPSGPAFCP